MINEVPSSTRTFDEISILVTDVIILLSRLKNNTASALVGVSRHDHHW